MNSLKRITLYLLTALLLIFSSCQNHDKLTAKINLQVDSLYQATGLISNSSKQFERLNDNINNFIKKYPADTLSPKYLLQMGLIYQRQNRFIDAVTTLERLQTEYPDARQNSTALFVEGFIYNNVLHDYVKTKEKYELYLQKYSAVNPKITRDVQLELANMGKSPDELFKEMQEKKNNQLNNNQ